MRRGLRKTSGASPGAPAQHTQPAAPEGAGRHTPLSDPDGALDSPGGTTQGTPSRRTALPRRDPDRPRRVSPGEPSRRPTRQGGGVGVDGVPPGVTTRSLLAGKSRHGSKAARAPRANRQLSKLHVVQGELFAASEPLGVLGRHVEHAGGHVLDNLRRECGYLIHVRLA